MQQNKLQLNDGKTQVSVISFPHYRQMVTMGFAVRVRFAGQIYGPTCHQRDRADVTEFVTLVRLSSLGQHVGVLALAGYKRRKSALTAGPIAQVQIGDSQIQPVTIVRNIGALLDNTVGIKPHAHGSSFCSRAHRYLRNICQVCHLLDQQSTAVLIHVYLTYRLDFGNALLLGLPANLLQGFGRCRTQQLDSHLGLVAETTVM